MWSVSGSCCVSECSLIKQNIQILLVPEAGPVTCFFFFYKIATLLKMCEKLRKYFTEKKIEFTNIVLQKEFHHILKLLLIKFFNGSSLMAINKPVKKQLMKPILD